jgi:mono/diheme cytochrome c family protein
MRRHSLQFLALLMLAGCGRDGAGSDTGDGSMALGQRVYQANCLSCHQANGSGVPSLYPPLTGTEWVIGDKGRLIRLVLNGMTGPHEVLGEHYNNLMPAQRFLSDQQIGAVLTFVRQQFGNDAEPVTADEVAAVRASTDRRAPWTSGELETETGIP